MKRSYIVQVNGAYICSKATAANATRQSLVGKFIAYEQECFTEVRNTLDYHLGRIISLKQQNTGNNILITTYVVRKISETREAGDHHYSETQTH